MTTPTIEQLLMLVDRAERGRLTPPEATALRAGLAALDAARRSAGGTQTALQAARTAQRQAETERDSARRWAVALESEAAELRAACQEAARFLRVLYAALPGGMEVYLQRIRTAGRSLQAALESPETPSGAATGPHDAPHTPDAPEGHPSPERPTRGRTGARTSTED